MTKPKYFKWFADKGPIYGFGSYVLDGGWQPRIDGELVPCHHGYHVCAKEQVARWRGDGLAEVEVDPEGMITVQEKTVVRSWRLVRWLPWTKKDMLDCMKVDTKACPSSEVCSFVAEAIREASAGNIIFADRYARAANEVAYTVAVFCAADYYLELDRQEHWIFDRLNKNKAKAARKKGVSRGKKAKKA